MLCPYCGGVVVAGPLSCPHCAAPASFSAPIDPPMVTLAEADEILREVWPETVLERQGLRLTTPLGDWLRETYTPKNFFQCFADEYGSDWRPHARRVMREHRDDFESRRQTA